MTRITEGKCGRIYTSRHCSMTVQSQSRSTGAVIHCSLSRDCLSIFRAAEYCTAPLLSLDGLSSFSLIYSLSPVLPIRVCRRIPSVVQPPSSHSAFPTMVLIDKHEYLSKEEERLKEDRERTRYWKRWGPYVAERQWATGSSRSAGMCCAPTGTTLMTSSLLLRSARGLLVSLHLSSSQEHSQEHWTCTDNCPRQ